MMKKKQAIMVVTLMLALAMVGVVYAAYPVVTISRPAASSTWNDTNTWNFSIGVPAGDAVDNTTLHNCSWYVYSSSTANSSSTVVLNKTIVNITREEAGNIINMNLSVNSNSFEDSNDYSVKVTCTATNGTRTSSDTNTGITIDNTVPTTPTSLIPAHQSTGTNGSMQFEATVTGARTTGCTLYFPSSTPGARSYTMTHSGNNCAYTFSRVPDGAYDWYIKASDGTNVTAWSVKQEIIMDKPKSSPGARAFAAGLLDDDGSAKGSSGASTNTIVVVLLIAGAVFLLKDKKLF